MAGSNLYAAPSAPAPPIFLETQHSDLIHDVQLDYYGKTLATASSDHSIKLFQVVRDKYEHIFDLNGHTGPVWRVSWAHPKYGQILASCGYDRRVVIWQYLAKHGQFRKVFEDVHNTSVNCIAFAPVDLGLYLIAGSSNGHITCYNFQKQWLKQASFKAHKGGVNGLSWSHQTSVVSAQALGSAVRGASSAAPPASGSQGSLVAKRFVSCGCEDPVKVWSWDHNDHKWKLTARLTAHNDWVRDVAWAPIPGSAAHSMVASCGEDRSVVIWKERAGKWKNAQQLRFAEKVWSVSWSELGNLLAVASGQNHVQLFKEGVDGRWNEVSSVNS